MQENAKDVTRRLKRLLSNGSSAEELVEAARQDLPFILGRLMLLEQFYSLNAPGFSDYSRIVSDQLGRPLTMTRVGILGTVERLFSGR